ncbi:MAG: CCA tRNA nucleotidyltransferase, mitochondrial [Watsoniomyces obsoletus]|nr:MAG: CCA tRNA nucleotidyltransferase, mitochondrial [Watsoniomyces obsoletus]
MGELLRFILSTEAQFSNSKRRLPALYSDFRQLHEVNPEGYTANISAWQSALAHASREGIIPGPDGSENLLILSTGEELLRELETKEWGRPLALGTVVKESLENKQLFPLQEFLTRSEKINTNTRAITPWQVLAWGLRLLGLAGGMSGEDKLPVGRFVVLKNVEEATNNVLKEVSGRDRVDRTFSKSLFKTEFERALNSRHPLSRADLDVLLKYLSRDKNAVVYDDEAIKFVAPGDRSTTITPEDGAIASLKTLIADQTSQIATLSRRVDELSVVARKSVTVNNKAAAMAALRSKKLAETMLTKRAENLAQLEEILNSIRHAADQVEMVKVMEASTGVLKSLHKQIGSVDKVEAVVDGLRDEMTQVDEVGQVINELGHVTGEDEVEVDEEFEAMEREEAEKRAKMEEAETARRLASLDELEARGAVVKSAAIPEKEREKSVEESIEALKRISLEEERPAAERLTHKDRHPEDHAVPAD